MTRPRMTAGAPLRNSMATVLEDVSDTTTPDLIVWELNCSTFKMDSLVAPEDDAAVR